MRPIIIGGGPDARTLLLLRGDEVADSSKYKREVTDAGAAAVVIAAVDPVPDGAFGQYYDLTGTTTGTAKHMLVPNDDVLQDVWNGNFTLEWWGARGTTSVLTMWFIKSLSMLISVNQSTATPPFQNRLSVTRYVSGSPAQLNSHAVADTDWHHYCVERIGDEWSVYVDGALVDSDTQATVDTNTNDIWIGRFVAGPSTFGMNGYMDDMRLSNAARYGGPFTPPGPHKR